jgi:membrane-associated phospholipid phosphatase
MFESIKLPDFKGNWKEAWKSPKTMVELFISIVVMFGIILFVTPFFTYIETRNGAVINDPILNLITPRDVSIFTFIFGHSSTLIGLIYISFYPKLLTYTLQIFAIGTSMRIISIYFIPLNPPEGIIPLVDPILGKLFYHGTVITKDLFFSGHTVAALIMFFVVKNKPLKIFLLCLAILVGLCLMIQHVHYSFDVLAAPFFTWIAYRIVMMAHK